MNVQSRVQEEALEAGLEPAAADDRAQLSLFELWQVLRVRRREFVFAALGLFLVILVVALTIPPRYEGNARVMLDTQQNNVVNVQQVLTGLTDDQPAILDQVQILQSRELAGRVVDKLHLDLDPEFASTAPPGSCRSSIRFTPCGRRSTRPRRRSRSASWRARESSTAFAAGSLYPRFKYRPLSISASSRMIRLRRP
jgi:hypothetical protein